MDFKRVTVIHMKFGELGATQDWTPQNRTGPSNLGGWSSHGPLILKTRQGTLRESYGIITYRSLHLKQAKEGKRQ